MLDARIDHITVTAPTLAAGLDYVTRAIGVTPQPGGAHPRMGTHNCLLRMGPALFLEVIAIDPAAPAPGRPRWFALDAITPLQQPRLAMWVARVNDIHAAVRESPLPIGKVEPMSRGGLNWLISIPEDGNLSLDGIAPALIQWHVDQHPASGMPDLGCSLIRLEGFHPEAEKVGGMLDAIGFDGVFSVASATQNMRPYLVAHIRTPAGVRQLGGPE